MTISLASFRRFFRPASSPPGSRKSLPRTDDHTSAWPGSPPGVDSLIPGPIPPPCQSSPRNWFRLSSPMAYKTHSTLYAAWSYIEFNWLCLAAARYSFLRHSQWRASTCTNAYTHPEPGINASGQALEPLEQSPAKHIHWKSFREGPEIHKEERRSRRRSDESSGRAGRIGWAPIRRWILSFDSCPPCGFSEFSSRPSDRQYQGIGFVRCQSSPFLSTQTLFTSELTEKTRLGFVRPFLETSARRLSPSFRSRLCVRRSSSQSMAGRFLPGVRPGNLASFVVAVASVFGLKALPSKDIGITRCKASPNLFRPEVRRAPLPSPRLKAGHSLSGSHR